MENQFTKVLPIFLLFIYLLIPSCSSSPEPILPEGPYLGNGFHNGWADQTSITLWARLTETPEGKKDGAEFIGITKEQHQRLRNSTHIDSIHGAQIPEGLTLDDMDGACPGMEGVIRLTYFPMDNEDDKQIIDWQAVDPNRNFTTQWSLRELMPGTTYRVIMEAQSLNGEVPTDTLSGQFKTAPSNDDPRSINFCVVTCHDYNRRDDPNGHLIYPAMQKLNPDFYVHAGDIEYYDKPNPYAMTEAMMYYKWDRLFALPFQRHFWANHTTYFMKDDHDVLADDAFPGMKYGPVSYERGLDIFDKEQFPTHNPTYKTIRWGQDLQIWIVEGRNYRSPNNIPDGPEKTIWGAKQIKWLFETVKASDATFKVLMTSTPILGPDRDQKNDNYSNSKYAHEGDKIRALIDEQENFYICNGDRHWQYVTHIKGTNLWEFSAGAGADVHAGGWKQDDVRPEHRFLRVKGGFLSGEVKRDGESATLTFRHHDVHGNVVHEETLGS